MFISSCHHVICMLLCVHEQICNRWRSHSNPHNIVRYNKVSIAPTDVGFCVSMYLGQELVIASHSILTYRWYGHYSCALLMISRGRIFIKWTSANPHHKRDELFVNIYRLLYISSLRISFSKFMHRECRERFPRHRGLAIVGIARAVMHAGIATKWLPLK